MKRGKTVGEDDLPVEVVAAAAEDAMGQLSKVMQIANRTESVPEAVVAGLLGQVG